MHPRGKMNTQQTGTETRVSSTQYFPHIDLILQSLRINRERLSSKSKIAIDARLLRLMLQTVAATLPFSEEFYMENYPDIADAYAAGKIPNLHQHFLDSGYLEGRIGYTPEIDEGFYLATYKDVGKAVAAGDVENGAEHYMRAGAAEGRVPNAAVRQSIDNWMAVLRDETGSR